MTLSFCFPKASKCASPSNPVCLVQLLLRTWDPRRGEAPEGPGVRTPIPLLPLPAHISCGATCGSEAGGPSRPPLPPPSPSGEEARVAGPRSLREHGVWRWTDTQNAKCKKEGICRFPRGSGCAELSTRRQAPGLHHPLESEQRSHFQAQEIQADGEEAACLRSPIHK